MKAVVVRQFGEPSELRVEDVSRPEASAGEALVKVLAAGINPSDVKNVQGAMAGTTLPRIPGRDFAGVVESGPAEMMGRQVWGTGGDIGFTRDGSHAQYMAIPAEALLEKPAHLPMEVAGAAGLVLVTAWTSLVWHAAVEAGDTVLIVGAAGGVGSAAVQIARYFGARVIAAVRGKEEAERAGQLGAEKTIDSSAASLVEEVRAHTGGDGADVAFDTSGHMFAECVEAAAHDGCVCVITAPADGMVNFNLRSLYRKELRVMGTDTRSLGVTACSKLLAEMAAGLEDGRLRPGAPTGYVLEKAGEAYSKAIQSRGRYCLLPHG